jgi:hypothetical protein
VLLRVYAYADVRVIFLIFNGNGSVVDRSETTDASVIRFCRAAFKAVLLVVEAGFAWPNRVLGL